MVNYKTPHCISKSNPSIPPVVDQLSIKKSKEYSKDYTCRSIIEEIAAIDLGSKNFKFLVGHQFNGQIKTELLKKETLMLGKELTEHHGWISEKKFTEIQQVLTDFKAYCDNRGIKTILAIGTSAIRSAKNNKRLSEITNSLGISFEIAKGMREGDIGYLAATLGKPEQLMSDMGSRSFQVAYQKKGDIVSLSHKAGYMIIFEKIYQDTSSFQTAHKHLRKCLKHHIGKLPQHTESFIALASNSMASFVTGLPKQEVMNQYLDHQSIRNKIKELKHKEFNHLKQNLEKANKILPGLTFIDYILEFSHHDKVLIVESELPVGLMVEYFRQQNRVGS
jgi:exopolyphosphatase/pppGpp-phosphohydrolase